MGTDGASEMTHTDTYKACTVQTELGTDGISVGMVVGITIGISVQAFNTY